MSHPLAIKIKKNPTTRATKFKLRCSKYLYTLAVAEQDKADKLKKSLPPGTSSEMHSACGMRGRVVLGDACSK